MTESGSDRQQQWVQVVRRSFGIADVVGDEDARAALVTFFEEQLQENGWQSATRAIADPMVDALLSFGSSLDLEDSLLAALPSSADTPTGRDAAHRLLDKGIGVVDPEHLVLDVTSDYPPEVVLVAQGVLDRVFRYAREQPFGA